MIEAKIKVESKHYSSNENCFFGATIIKSVYERTLLHEKDERINVAPCGLIATITLDRSYEDLDDKKVNAKQSLLIKINANYFDHEAENRYVAFFDIDDSVFEVCVWFDVENKDVEDITLSEWVDKGCFEDGDDADVVYGFEDFTIFEKYVS